MRESVVCAPVVLVQSLAQSINNHYVAATLFYCLCFALEIIFCGPRALEGYPHSTRGLTSPLNAGDCMAQKAGGELG